MQAMSSVSGHHQYACTTRAEGRYTALFFSAVLLCLQWSVTWNSLDTDKNSVVNSFQWSSLGSYQGVKQSCYRIIAGLFTCCWLNQNSGVRSASEALCAVFHPYSGSVSSEAIGNDEESNPSELVRI